MPSEISGRLDGPLVGTEQSLSGRVEADLLRIAHYILALGVTTEADPDPNHSFAEGVTSNVFYKNGPEPVRM